MKAKHYCIVYGCLNTNKDPNLTFFTLPKDIERRRKWLTLINREDLLQKEELKRTSHLVCSAHFEDSAIKIIKHLKETALPSILLDIQPQEGLSCSETPSTSTRMKGKGKLNELSNNKEYYTVGTQTELLHSTEKQTQTNNPLTKDALRKRKLPNKRECKLKRPKVGSRNDKK